MGLAALSIPGRETGSTASCNSQSQQSQWHWDGESPQSQQFAQLSVVGVAQQQESVEEQQSEADIQHLQSMQSHSEFSENPMDENATAKIITATRSLTARGRMICRSRLDVAGFITLESYLARSARSRLPRKCVLLRTRLPVVSSHIDVTII